MASEMVERLARAIHGAALVYVTWEYLAEWERREFQQKARAVLAMLREPTEAMCEAGDKVAISYWPYSESTPNAEEAWRAMIDAALKE